MAILYFLAPHFNDEAAAYAFVEEQVEVLTGACPHYGTAGEKSEPDAGQEHPHRRAKALGLPEALYRQDRHHL